MYTLSRLSTLASSRWNRCLTNPVSKSCGSPRHPEFSEIHCISQDVPLHALAHALHEWIDDSVFSVICTYSSKDVMNRVSHRQSLTSIVFVQQKDWKHRVFRPTKRNPTWRKETSIQCSNYHLEHQFRIQTSAGAISKRMFCSARRRRRPCWKRFYKMSKRCPPLVLCSLTFTKCNKSNYWQLAFLNIFFGY